MASFSSLIKGSIFWLFFCKITYEILEHFYLQNFTISIDKLLPSEKMKFENFHKQTVN